MMMIILFTTLFIILAILSIFRNILLALLAGVFGVFKRDKNKVKPNEPKVRYNTKKKKKVYSENEGEYVEYEEVK